MMSRYWLSLFALLMMVNSLGGEIEEIRIQWNAQKCLDACSAQIETNLKAIKEVTNVQTDKHAGIAVMKWNSQRPFNFDPFKLAIAAAGIGIDEMRLSVSGKITHDTQNTYLTSTDDNTRFTLVSSSNPQPGQYVPKYRLATRPL